jgi:hypothetical protein
MERKPRWVQWFGVVLRHGGSDHYEEKWGLSRRVWLRLLFALESLHYSGQKCVPSSRDVPMWATKISTAPKGAIFIGQNRFEQ